MKNDLHIAESQKPIYKHDAVKTLCGLEFFVRTVDPIPEGLDLDHLCRNRACVNPAHLEPVTRQENLRRGVGTKLKGKLVEQVKAAYLSGKTFKEVALEFKVSKSALAEVLKGLRHYKAKPCANCGSFLSKTHVCGAKKPRAAKPYQLRKQCSNGHEMDERNTYWRNGRASCRKCNLDATWKRRGKVVPAKPTEQEFDEILGIGSKLGRMGSGE